MTYKEAEALSHSWKLMLRLLACVFTTFNLCHCSYVTKYAVTWGYVSANFVCLLNVFENKIVKNDFAEVCLPLLR